MKKKYIGLFDSTYALFLFLLKYPERFENTYFLIGDGIPTFIRKKIKNSYFNPNYTNKKGIPGIIIRCFYRLKILFIAKIINPPIVYGQDHLLGADILISRYEFHLFEDGYINYSFKRSEKERKLLLFIKEKFLNLKSIEPFGVEKNVKKIYLTGLAEVPKAISLKTHIISIQKIWNEKTDIQKKQILDFYNFNTRKISEIKLRSVLLITQPLSEDDIITESEKIELYRKITKDINPLELVIKVHPREKTKYKKVFPNALILDNPFPSQLLKLVDIDFSKIITLYSTAASDYLNDKNTLVFYGTQYDRRFVERHGIIFYNTTTNSISINSSVS